MRVVFLRQGEGVVNPRVATVKRGIEAGHLYRIGEGVARGADAGEVVRLMQGRERLVFFERFQNLIGDDDRGGVLRAAVHHAMPDAGDAVRMQQGFAGLQDGV